MKLSAFTLISLASLALATPNGGERGPQKPEQKNPLVTSAELSNTIYSSNLLKHTKKFLKFSQFSGGTRAFGSTGHNATVKYLKSLLDNTGYYDTEYQTFPYLYSEGTAQFSRFTYGPGGYVAAPLIVTNNLGCEIVTKYLALDVGPYVPAGSTSGVDGNALVARVQAGETVLGTLEVEATDEERYASNVIATTKTGDKSNIVVAGSHTDSVPAGPDINDDGSGTIGILEIALQLPRWSVKNAVRFGFWTAEGYCLVGSEHYTALLSDAERAKIALYLNFDMIASPNLGYFIYDGDGSTFNITGPSGSDHIEKTFEDFFKTQKVRSAPTEFSGRSDYGTFLDVGGQADVNYDICYHKACDGLSNINLKSWSINTKAAAHSIATYARSLDGISRGSDSKREVRVREPLPHDQRRHQSCSHEILIL
ncbi:hypothetical protein BDQ17DRAFT_1390645 [Cyathus striatus]|nr:hypothetical protein BDQ17DRAFT_1390645 [Cyathus striatus]